MSPNPAASSGAVTTSVLAIENGPGPQVCAFSPGGGRNFRITCLGIPTQGLSSSARQTAVQTARGARPASGDRAAAGLTWSDRDLVFPTRTGAALDAANVRREFKAACKAANIGANWTPRELRHSFVSLMSSSAARLVSHCLSSIRG